MLCRDVAISEDFVQETWADNLARVRRHDRAPPVLVAEEVMAAFDPENVETGLGERRDEFRAGDARSATHAAIVTRWMPTNSKS